MEFVRETFLYKLGYTFPSTIYPSGIVEMIFSMLILLKGVYFAKAKKLEFRFWILHYCSKLILTNLYYITLEIYTPPLPPIKNNRRQSLFLFSETISRYYAKLSRYYETFVLLREQ